MKFYIQLLYFLAPKYVFLMFSLLVDSPEFVECIYDNDFEFFCQVIHVQFLKGQFLEVYFVSLLGPHFLATLGWDICIRKHNHISTI